MFFDEIQLEKYNINTYLTSFWDKSWKKYYIEKLTTKKYVWSVILLYIYIIILNIWNKKNSVFI